MYIVLIHALFSPFSFTFLDDFQTTIKNVSKSRNSILIVSLFTSITNTLYM